MVMMRPSIASNVLGLPLGTPASLLMPEAPSVRWQFPAVIVLFACMAMSFGIIAGCRQPSDEREASKVVGQTRMADDGASDGTCQVLTIEAAKQALLDMVERESVPPMKSTLSNLRSARGEQDEYYPNITLLDSWRCNIPKRTFNFPYASVEYGVGDFSGFFEFDEKKQQWAAVITKHRRIGGIGTETTYDDNKER